MKELLQRLSALDEGASAALKIITFFDTLLSQRAGLEPFVRGAAVLSGWPAGFGHPVHQLWIRVDPSGHALPPVSDLASIAHWPHLEFNDGSGAIVWIERDGEPNGNDSLTLERLAAGLRLTLERVSPMDLDDAGALEILLSPTSTDDVRRKAARRLRLPADRALRVVAAPPDVVAPEGMRSTLVDSPVGTVLVGVVEARSTARPEHGGVGSAVSLRGVPTSWREALLAVRMSTHLWPVVDWDELGVLGPMLAASESAEVEPPDVERVAAVLQEPWGLETLDALTVADSHRGAAHVLGLHHSTVQARVAQVEHELGFGVSSPPGRFRLALALRLYQVRHVRFPHSGAS